MAYRTKIIGRDSSCLVMPSPTGIRGDYYAVVAMRLDSRVVVWDRATSAIYTEFCVKMAEFTAKEIAQHTAKTDLWFVVHGKVVDATKYVDDHPGGPDVFLELGGKDATTAFEDAGHSDDAIEIMEGLVVGTKKGAKVTTSPTKAPEILVPVAPASSSWPNKGVKYHIITENAKGLTVLAVGAFAAVLLVPRGGSQAGATATSGATGATTTGLFQLSEWLHTSKLGFLSGFALASSIFGVVSMMTLERLPRLVQGKEYTQLPRHVKAERTTRRDLISVRGFLEPKTYQGLPLIDKVEVAPGIFHFIFELPTPQTVLGLPVGQHVAIKAEVNGEAVTRSYTPISNNTDLGRLELMIRCYPDGLLSGNYLRHLKVGDEVLFRGPRGPMRYQRGLAKNIGMIAGGTGVTPMFQLIRAICEDSEDTTQVSLVYGNRSVDDILLRQKLDSYARRYPNTFKVWYLLDRAPDDWAFGKGYVNAEIVENFLPGASQDTKILLCGPPGMVNACKKTLVALGYNEPGAVTKMTDQVFLY
ncbi:hypothetical protein BX600DRAFT_441542 [Xylariales sp. PMI_506]|nr:hypothetical protein BX600DRAFT_441542 [Xylariales sp. PMI_506]